MNSPAPEIQRMGSENQSWEKQSGLFAKCFARTCQNQVYATSKCYFFMEILGQKSHCSYSKHHKDMENYTFPAVKDILWPFVQSNNSKTAELWNQRLGTCRSYCPQWGVQSFQSEKWLGVNCRWFVFGRSMEHTLYTHLQWIWSCGMQARPRPQPARVFAAASARNTFSWQTHLIWSIRVAWRKDPDTCTFMNLEHL